MSGKTAPLLAWLAVIAIAGFVLVTRVSFSYDLALFLPKAQAPEQQVLLERLGDAPGSRFLLIGVPSTAQQQADIVGELAYRLDESALFSRVLTETSLGDLDRVPEPLWSYRYLLADVALDTEGLKKALQERRTELTLMAGGPLVQVIARDPHLISLETLAPFAGSTDGSWRSEQGDHLLIAETAAPAFDLQGQQAALQFINEALAELQVANAELSGVGVFGVGVRDTIRREATVRSIAASVALALVLLLTYRRLAPLWLAALPLLTGMLLGLSAVAVGFGQVHGITLAFGFTLMGIALDYPLHLISTARTQPAQQAARQIWPTLRLGAASTAVAYLAIALGGSEGLAQLGLFSLVGVIAAALTTRWVLPTLMSRPAAAAAPASPSKKTSPTLSWLALPVLVAVGLGCVAISWQGAFWNNNLSAMSPVPAELIARDTQLRQALGTPDLSRQIMLRDENLDRLLKRTASLDAALAETVGQGLVGRYQSAASLLPDPDLQRRRQASLPVAEVLSSNVTLAMADLPFKPAAFSEFMRSVEQSRQLDVLTPQDYAGTPLESLLAQFFYRADNQWVSLISLYPPINVEGLSGWLLRVDEKATVIDLKRASENLVADYRNRTFGVLGIALAIIFLLLLWRLPARRSAWCVATVLCVLVACAGLNYLINGPLNLYHLMALLLVAGLGLDYGLFLSRPSSAADAQHARHAVLACAASTALTFAVLALSDIPALSAMGATVATGVTLAFVATNMTARRTKAA